MTTMHDVAAHAKVSAKTVSRVYNDDPQVAPATRERVLAAMKALNYVPNSLALNFRAGRAPIIGLAVPDIADPFFAAIARAIEDTAAKRKMAVAVTSLGEDPAREQMILESLLQWRLSGLIIAPISDDQSYLKRWSAHTPLIFIDRSPTKLSADSFIDDDRGGASHATTHLLKHGHSRVGFIGGTVKAPTTSKRLEGYRQALEAAGIPYDPSLVAFEAHDRRGAQSALQQLLALADAPTAIFSSDARCSMALAPSMQGAAVADVAVVGFGDFPMADALQPGMTVIDQNPDSLGRHAIHRVFERLENPNRRFLRRTVLPVTLIERGSCFLGSGLPGSDVLTDAAGL